MTTSTGTRLTELQQKITRDPATALREIHTQMRADPSRPELLRQAAMCHRAMGQRAEAERAEIGAIQLAERDDDLIKAAKLMAEGEHGDASQIAADVLKRHPDDLTALTMSAETAIAMGLSHKALPLLEQVLSRAASYMRARVLYANALMLNDRLRDALKIVEPMVARRPDDAELVNLVSRIRTDLGDHQETVKANRELVRIDPETPESHANLGDSLRFAGERDEAIEAYRKALSLDPDHGRAWWSLADLDAGEISDADVGHMREALERRKGELEHAGNLHFALGIALDKRGEIDAAFEHFAAGNQLRRDAQPYDASELSELVDRYLDAMTADRIPDQGAPVSGEPTPIFVLGMPRAGSTLVERILGRHSQIEALGELAIVPHMVERIRNDAGADKVAEVIAGLSDAALENMGKWYVARARERMKTQSAYFVDKLHMNWRHLPLILRMLPQAKIIDIRRDAMDCCWSNSKVLFARGHPAASDMVDIAKFYRDYVRQTDTLRERSPARIHLQDYEALVDNIEAETQAMFSFMDIEFEPDVIEFHLSQEPVATASSEQVRKPLNRKGIGAWKRYAEHLGPMREALGELASD